MRKHPQDEQELQLRTEAWRDLAAARRHMAAYVEAMNSAAAQFPSEPSLLDIDVLLEAHAVAEHHKINATNMLHRAKRKLGQVPRS